MTPAIEVPWPPRYFVAEWMTTSAPHSIGRRRNGVAMVLSTTSGTPTSCATPATPSMSSSSALGLAIVSPKNALVFGLTAARHASRFVWSSTKVTSMPSFLKVYLRRLTVPP